MQAQRGVALVIVMVLLASTAMLGISAMHASLLENKQAASYRATALVQMASESAAIKLLENPTNSVLASCAGHHGWDAFNAFSSVHPAVQLECRQCVDSIAGHCLNNGDKLDVVINGGAVEHSVTATFLLRAQLVGQARTRAIASRTLVITRFHHEVDDTSTLRWHAL